MDTNKILVALVIAFALVGLTGVVSAESAVELQIDLISGFATTDVTYKHTTSGGLPYDEATYQSSLKSINSDMSLSHSFLAEGSNIQSETWLSAGEMAGKTLLVGPTIQTVLYEESISRELIKGGGEGGCVGESEGECEEEAVCFKGESEFAFLVNKIDVTSTSITEEAGTMEHAIDATGYGDFKVGAAVLNLYGSPNGSYAQEAMYMSINTVYSEFSFSSFFYGHP